jgi:glyoxylase-like metal-dependent hydrolase (beta-lactamase superfamily II)/8-oxo-dGTP pyrophosphatase MutT (NUDIX family)
VTDAAIPRPPRSTAGGGPVVARPAATVVLLRPAAAAGASGPEVLLTLRPGSMAFGGGLHVFPGGRVEAADGDPRILARAVGGDAHRVGAIRELFEEAGVLLAVHSDGAPVGADDRLAGELPRLRSALAAGDLDLLTILERHDLQLPTDQLVPIGRWQTPRAYPRRFDARFFAIELPAGAVLDLDPREVAGHAWLTPSAALAEMTAGRIQLWPPTSSTLQRLERARDIDAIRAGLELVDGLPFGRAQLAPGLIRLTGGVAFGAAGRPANTILVGRERIVVVDPGDPDEDFIDLIEAEAASLGGRIVAIALTHVDPGHAAGSIELQERTGAPIFVGSGGGASLSWAVTEVEDGATLDPGDMPLVVIGTPGHRPDHLAFRLPDSTILSGDALTDRPTFVLPPLGNAQAARASLARIAALRPGRIVPGHGPTLGDPSAAIQVSLEALTG